MKKSGQSSSSNSTAEVGGSIRFKLFSLSLPLRTCVPNERHSLSLRAFGDVDWSACGAQVVRRGRGEATGRARCVQVVVGIRRGGVVVGVDRRLLTARVGVGPHEGGLGGGVRGELAELQQRLGEVRRRGGSVCRCAHLWKRGRKEGSE